MTESEISTDSLDILYQDDHYIAINKPPALLVHRTSIDAQETRFAIQMLRDQIGQYVYPVHRIDKATSGVLLFALDEIPLIETSKLFEDKNVFKTYLTITRGHAPDSGLIDRPLRKLNDKSGPNKTEVEQDAITRFETIARSELPYPTERYSHTRYSLVKLHPETGRRHQLRRHIAGIGHPIIGDTRHGDNKENKRFRERFGFVRLFLHAFKLEFAHPITGASMLIEAPVWPDFRRALKATKLEIS